MDNSLLAVRDINHKNIVVERGTLCDPALPPRFFGVRVANKNKKPQEFSPFNACVIPFTEEAYSIGAIPVAFLNCFEK